jgi:hypothetical protein
MALFDECTEHKASDATESVDGDCSHMFSIDESYRTRFSGRGGGIVHGSGIASTPLCKENNH